MSGRDEKTVDEFRDLLVDAGLAVARSSRLQFGNGLLSPEPQLLEAQAKIDAALAMLVSVRAAWDRLDR